MHIWQTHDRIVSLTFVVLKLESFFIISNINLIELALRPPHSAIKISLSVIKLGIMR